MVLVFLLLGFVPIAAAKICAVPDTFATIQGAVNDAGCDEIEVDPGIFAATVTVDRDVTIRGTTRSTTSIQGTITINNNALLVLSRVTIELTGSDAILLDSAAAGLEADDFEISFNSFGIVHGPTASGTPVTISNCDIHHNQIGVDVRGVLTIDTCVVSDNTPRGGIKVLGKGVITDSIISNNTNSAVGDGGGILFDHNAGTLSSIHDSTISGNLAEAGNPASNTSDGGGIMVRNGRLLVKRCDILGNVAGRHGGGIANSDVFGSLITIEDSTISGNLAYSDGGGIAVADPTTISNSLIENNRARFNGSINSNGLAVGGGIYVFEDGLTLTDSTVRGNSAQTEIGVLSVNSGGGLYINTDQPVTIERSTISGNFAEVDGGGLFIATATTMNNATIANNRANRDGGGIYTNGAAGAVLTHGTISGNTADDDNSSGGDGGGINGNILLSFALIGDNIDKSTSPANNPDCSGGALSTAYSFIGIVNGCGSFDAGTGNQMGSIASPLDLLLLPLADNGGPTQTVALDQLSPALDAGTTACVSATPTDQRGIVRKFQDGNNDGGTDSDPCDIGAYETFSSGCATGSLALSSYTYVDMQTIQSETDLSTNGDLIIASTADILFEAGSSIDLGPGFEVEVGSTFAANVTGVSCP